MFSKFRSILFTLAFLFFLFPSFVHAAASKTIGEFCDGNGECFSGDCEDGVCDCNPEENSNDCAQKYGGNANDWRCVEEDIDPLNRGLDFCVKKTYSGGTPYPETDTADVKYPLPRKLVIGEKCGGAIDYPTPYQNIQCASNDCEDSSGDETYDNYCVCDEPKDCFEAYGLGNEDDWECLDGSNIGSALWGGSNYANLHYCKQRSTNKAFSPVEKANGGFLGAIQDPEGFMAQFSANIDDSLKQPNPKIKIPGLVFSEIDIQTMLTEEDNQVYLNIPYIGEFITALYRFAIVVASIISIVIIIVAGAQWMMSGGGDGKQQALKRIAGAASGLILAVGSYLILYGINPNLVRFKSLKIKYIEREEIPQDLITIEEQQGNVSFASGKQPANIAEAIKNGTVVCDNPIAPGSYLVPLTNSPGLILPSKETAFLNAEAATAIKKAGEIAQKKGYVLKVTSACRSSERQRTLALKQPASVLARTLAEPGSSPHGFGLAVDVSLMKNNKVLVRSNNAAIQCNEPAEYVKILSEIMYEAGFYRYAVENWHFELPPKTTYCRVQNFTAPSPCVHGSQKAKCPVQ